MWNISLSFKIKSEDYKLCDINIHDSGSSQPYDFNGNEIKTLQFMSYDPIYCNPVQGFNNSISYINVKNKISITNWKTFNP